MSRIRRHDVAGGPVGSEGGLSPSALSIGENGGLAGGAARGPLATGQRWSVSRKREVVIRLLRGEAAEDLSRGHRQLIEKGSRLDEQRRSLRIRRSVWRTSPLARPGTFWREPGGSRRRSSG